MKVLFQLALMAYPRGFRRRFGAETVELAVRDCRRAFERGWWRGWTCVGATACDVVLMGLADRVYPTWPGEGDDATHEPGVGTMLRHFMRDLRHATRALRNSPGFTITSVATLALALGVNAGIFSVVDAVLLDPLPYADSDRLVHIAASAPGSDFPDEFGVSAEFYVQYRDHATQLEDVAMFNAFTASVRAGDRVERLPVSMPSLSLFEMLGVAPILGRWPSVGEGGQVALISHGLWTTWFGRDPTVIGSAIFMVDGMKTVIGVMPPDFGFPSDRVMGWVPTELQATDITPGRFGLQLVGRMSPGADHAALGRELQALALRLPELYGGSASYARTIEQHVPVVRSIDELLRGEVEGPLQLLMGAVLVVLLIACANIANLFSVRAEGRRRDLAVRKALGAGRGRLIGAQLAEALVVAVASGVLALALAWLFLPAFLAVVPEGLPRMDAIGVSGTTVLFTFGAAVVASLAFGLVPAVRSSAPDLQQLRDGARGSTRRHHWGRNGLVVAQTALALVLLVGSGLLLRSFQHLRSVDPGFDTEGILTFQFAPEEAHLVDGPTWGRFHADFMERLRTLPGVETVGIVENVPLDEGVAELGFQVEGQLDDGIDRARAGVTFAGGDYFEAMGIDVLEGRAFVDDDLTVPGAVVVSRAAADLLWPGEPALGRQLRNTRVEEWHTVVGVVDDVVQRDFRQAPQPLVYYPLVGPTPTSWVLPSPGYVVRSDRAEALVPEIRELIREVSPSAPMYRVYTMAELSARSMVGLSFIMLTMVVAASLALILGAIGLYGVLSYLVAERTQEIGVRMALGAEAARVRRMVVGQGVRVVGVGIIVGLGVALVATRALSSLLYGVAPVDGVTFAATALAMAAVGWLASYVPARRASRVDPLQSMRGR